MIAYVQINIYIFFFIEISHIFIFYQSIEIVNIYLGKKKFLCVILHYNFNYCTFLFLSYFINYILKLMLSHLNDSTNSCEIIRDKIMRRT